MEPLTKARRVLSFEILLVIIAATIGFAWNLQAISDNTALVHVRTGIDMFRSGDVLSADPYSYTATGHEWILQSWLTEYFYGALHALWSSKLIALVNAVFLAVLAGGLVAMVRTGKPWLTFVNAAAVLLLGINQWSTRPTTFGFLLFFALLAVAKRSLWWTALVGVLWVNMHGSWPIGILWLAGVAIGTAIDERRVTKALFKRVSAFTAAVVVGGICNPVGWKLLTFPLVALEKGDVFSQITEWHSPDFHTFSDLSGYGPLLGILLSITVLMRLRVSWRHFIPFAGLLAMSLYSSRNLPMLAIGLASILAVAWREYQQQPGVRAQPATSMSNMWGPIGIFCIVVMSFVSMFQVVRLIVNPDYDLTAYPVAGVAYAEQLGYFGEGKRVLAPDFVGCYRILQKGKNASVFIDDRYDMYPAMVSRDLFTIIDIGDNTHGLLRQYDVEAVLWPKDRTLSNHLTTQSDWSTRWSDKHWILLTRNADA